MQQLLFGDDSEVKTMRWRIFEWITSMAPNVIEQLKTIPQKNLLIVAVLCVLVKVYFEYSFIFGKI